MSGLFVSSDAATHRESVKVRAAAGGRRHVDQSRRGRRSYTCVLLFSAVGGSVGRGVLRSVLLAVAVGGQAAARRRVAVRVSPNGYVRGFKSSAIFLL